MPNKKMTSTSERIDKELEKISQMQNRVKVLKQRQNAVERKARTHHFCRRHGLFESLLPESAGLTDEQFKSLIMQTTANDYGKSVLARIMSEHKESG